jgi:hypothetical protein
VEDQLPDTKNLKNRRLKLMTTLRILNGNVARLKGLLGDLANDLEIKAGDTLLACETEEQIEVGRAVFEKLLTGGGYTAIQVNPETKETIGRLTEFDPQADLVVLFGPVAGG